MKPTKEEFDLLKLIASLEHREKNYVWLREDEKGTYIEYAFIEGAPHDNRCLSWYYSLQPNAIRRNNKSFGNTEEDSEKEIEWRKNRIKKYINNLFVLQSFTCGYEENLEASLKYSEESWNKFHPGEPFIKENHICKVGHPAPKCIENKMCAHWTYKEPAKCACWTLDEVKIPSHVLIPVEDLKKLNINI